MIGCGTDTASEVDLQQSQIELLQQQNALLQDQIDQLEQTVATLQTDWNAADVADRLDALEDVQGSAGRYRFGTVCDERSRLSTA